MCVCIRLTWVRSAHIACSTLPMCVLRCSRAGAVDQSNPGFVHPQHRPVLICPTFFATCHAHIFPPKQHLGVPRPCITKVMHGRGTPRCCFGGNIWAWHVAKKVGQISTGRCCG